MKIQILELKFKKQNYLRPWLENVVVFHSQMPQASVGPGQEKKCRPAISARRHDKTMNM
jgi:hypothetical protein